MKALALFIFALAAAPTQDTHSFESPSFLDHYRDETLVIPGAQSNVTSIQLHVSFNSKHAMGAENTSMSNSQVAMHANPRVKLGPLTKQLQGFGWSKNLRKFDGAIDYQGGSGTSHGTTVGHTVLLTTITDPQVLQLFVGSEVSIPLQFMRSNSVAWTSGTNNKHRVDSLFGWHGIIKYNY